MNVLAIVRAVRASVKRPDFRQIRFALTGAGQRDTFSLGNLEYTAKRLSTPFGCRTNQSTPFPQFKSEEPVMSFADNQQYQSTPWGQIAARAEPDERSRAYQEDLFAPHGRPCWCSPRWSLSICEPDIAATLAQTLMGNGRGGWLVVMLLFMGVAWLANYWAMSSTSVGMQYAGLGLYVAAQSIISRRCCSSLNCRNLADRMSFQRRE